MPRRSQLYNKIPWNGGINSTVDPGVLPDNDLATADNIQFTTSGARIKRDGYDYLDAESAIPTVITRSSSGTTRTLVFDATVSSATNEKLVVGEAITVASTGGETDYIGDYTIVSITTTTLTNDTITYTAAGSLTEGATSTSTLTVTRNHSLIGLHDYWRTNLSGVKTQLLVAVSDQGKIYKYDSAGRRTEIDKDGAATALSSPTRAMFEVINETLIIALDGTANTPKKYNPDLNVDWEDLGGSPPNGDTVSEHLGRLFMNDKTNRDRLHYSPPGSPEEWEGVGDSGALDVFPGDGDPEGIIALSPSFKDSLFVGKKTKVIELTGDSPENFRPQPITNGLGMVAPKAVVAVDLDDLVFVSDRGFHSLVATSNRGDFSANFLSTKIQNDFNSFEPAFLERASGAYLSEINSIAFSIAPDGASENTEVWLFNTLLKEWYRWPSISCQSLTTRLVDQRERRLVFGTSDGRVIQAQNGDSTDFNNTAIDYKITTGAIYPDNNPQTLKLFKRLTLYFKPKGEFSFNVKYIIDNQPEQTTSISQSTSSIKLGVDHLLGGSLLGFAGVFAPITVPIDGLGRGVTIEITDDTVGQPIELYGFGIEYEQADINQETL